MAVDILPSAIQEKKIFCHWMAELFATAVWKKQLSAIRTFHEGPTRFLDSGEQSVCQEEKMSDRQKRLVRKRLLLGETDGLGRDQMRIQLEPLVRAVMSLLVNGRGLLGVPTTSSPRKETLCQLICKVKIHTSDPQ
jgi:hypothetical protein